MSNDIDLKGRIAVVTGGAQGFGKAITERFLKSGARVAIWDHDIALAQKTAKALGEQVDGHRLRRGRRRLGRQGAATPPSRRSGASTSSSTTPASPAPTPRSGRRTWRNGAR